MHIYVLYYMYYYVFYTLNCVNFATRCICATAWCIHLWLCMYMSLHYMCKSGHRISPHGRGEHYLRNILCNSIRCNTPFFKGLTFGVTLCHCQTKLIWKSENIRQKPRFLIYSQAPIQEWEYGVYITSGETLQKLVNFFQIRPVVKFTEMRTHAPQTWLCLKVFNCWTR